MVVTGLSPVLYFLHLIGVGVYASVSYVVAKTIHTLRVQVDFVLTEIELSFAQLVKHHG